MFFTRRVSRTLLLIFLVASSRPQAQTDRTQSQAATTDPKPLPAAVVDVLRVQAASGDANAQFKLALVYAQGLAGEKQPAEAAKWLRKAAEQGHVEAQYGVALAYRDGYGVAQDANEAKKWFRLAAEQGHMDAQYSLAKMLDYANPADLAALLGTPGSKPGAPGDQATAAAEQQRWAQAQEEALKWFRAAAQQGHVWAQFRMIRGETDKVESLKWRYLLADHCKDVMTSAVCDEFRLDEPPVEELTPVQRAQARARAEEIKRAIAKRKG